MSPLDGTHHVASVMGVSGREGGALGLPRVGSGPAIGLGGYPSKPAMAWEPGAKLPQRAWQSRGKPRNTTLGIGLLEEEILE